MCWRKQKLVSSSMSLLSVLVLVCLAPGLRGQRPRDPEDPPPDARPQLAEQDALCHPEGCYAVFLQKRSFREAGRSCRERGGTLATMHSHQAAARVHQLLSAVQGPRARIRLWIGLHRPPRQCGSFRPLRGFVWVTGDQDGQFTHWLREESPGSCAAPRCVAMTVLTSDGGRESSDNFGWQDGSCALLVDGYVCQYNYKGMCSPLEDEGSGAAVYTTPFHLLSSLLTHVPLGSVATLPCPTGPSDPVDPVDLGDPAEQTVMCIERDGGSVGWSRDAPYCSAGAATQNQDWCSGDHGCEQFCQNTDTDYYCYCSEGFTIDEDGYGCRPDPLSPTDAPELSADSAGPSEPPHMKEVCRDMGCEYDCMETSRGTRCTCPPGYQMGRDGRGCSDVDECQQQPCPHVCVNIPGTFHCSCRPGFTQDDEGECVDVDECLDSASCETGCENTPGSFRCVCGPGYEPDGEGKCVDVDECREDDSCAGSCENTPGSFRCVCDPGYEFGAAGTCKDVDECVGESPCEQQCLNYMGGYQCYCDNGYDLQPDGLSCRPSPDDEEYSTLTPDPSDTDHGAAWYTAFTPDPNFEADSNFDVDWLTDAPDALSPDMAHGSDNHLNQWDAPQRHHTAPPPTQTHNTGNEIDTAAETKGREASDVAGSATKGTHEETGSGVDGAGGVSGAAAAADEGAGKRKHDKSWLLVALLVPLCVFLVVMLALGIVYCTSCAVDKSLSFSDCHRWILPTAPPGRGDAKAQA